MKKQFTMEDVPVLYEDKHIIVVVKPQNMPSQEDKSGDTDLFNLLKEYIRQKYDKQGNVFLGLVHRLDRTTGGLMVFAKNSKCAARLSEAIKNGEVDKRYLAVLVGKPREKSATTEGAKRSELSYKLLDSVDDVISLVKIKLETGRSHQIRVQFSCRGLPVFGDARYGGNTLMKGANLALWAAELSFLHPVTKDKMVFVSYPPEDNEPWKKFNLEKYLDYGHFNSQID